MPASDCIGQSVAASRRARLLEARWQKLCAVYLPRASTQPIWRASPAALDELPQAGWKLHISATILNAPAVLKRVAPFLNERGVQFKAPRSLNEVQKLNAGLDYSYSQVGKIITVYPRNDREAVDLARELHRLTARFAAPSVPFDLQFCEQSNVYYRFGAFEHLEIDCNGEKKLATYDANGQVIPDVREEPKPDWVTDPFEKHRPIPRRRASVTNDRIRVLHALAQRGKGGVYAAVDVSGKFPQLCLLKEGRKHGEVSWDGRDGAWRIKNEALVLAQLASAGVPVPAIRSSFETDGDHYLIMDYLDGETLHRFLYRRRRRMPIFRAIDFSLQLANFLAQMHAAGWVWRDCKPNNIIVTRAGHLVPIDFEGAARINRPDYSKWGTPGFTPPEWRERMMPSDKTDDLYSLGAMIYLLLTGRIYESDQPAAIETLRRHVPPVVLQLTRSLLSVNRRDRPSAAHAGRVLKAISLKLKPQRARRPDIKAA